MPTSISVTVKAARDLPIMDRSSKSADPYVNVHLGETQLFQTTIFKKTLNPTWDETYTHRITCESLHENTTFHFKVWDKDYLTQDNMIGIVSFDWTTLTYSCVNNGISGWFPIIHTEYGTRGELFIQVFINYSSEMVVSKPSPTQNVFMSTALHPLPEMQIVSTVGVVRDLVVRDDPEYEWQDRIRTSVISNDNRTTVLYSMTSLLRRRLCYLASEYQCNAVLGFTLAFDVGEEGVIVARAMGTACTVHSIVGIPRVISQTQSSTASTILPLNVQPWPHVLFCTLESLPAEYTLIRSLSVRAVHVCGKWDEVSKERRIWWGEVQDALRREAQQAGANIVLGYTETTTTSKDICILSASGTAISLNPVSKSATPPVATFTPCSSFHLPPPPPSGAGTVPQSPTNNPNLPICVGCSKANVSSFLMCTIEPPAFLSTLSSLAWVNINAASSQKLTFSSTETLAEAVSSILPHLEIEINQQLSTNTAILTRNALFNYSCNITFCGDEIVATASATAIFIPFLPLPPPTLSLAASKSSQSKEINFSELDKLSQSEREKAENCSNDFKAPSLTSHMTIPLIVGQGSTEPSGAVQPSSQYQLKQTRRLIETLFEQRSYPISPISLVSLPQLSSSPQPHQVLVVQIREQLNAAFISDLLSSPSLLSLKIFASQTFPSPQLPNPHIQTHSNPEQPTLSLPTQSPRPSTKPPQHPTQSIASQSTFMSVFQVVNIQPSTQMSSSGSQLLNGIQFVRDRMVYLAYTSHQSPAVTKFRVTIIPSSSSTLVLFGTGMLVVPPSSHTVEVPFSNPLSMSESHLLSKHSPPQNKALFGSQPLQPSFTVLKTIDPHDQMKHTSSSSSISSNISYTSPPPVTKNQPVGISDEKTNPADVNINTLHPSQKLSVLYHSIHPANIVVTSLAVPPDKASFSFHSSFSFFLIRESSLKDKKDNVLFLHTTMRDGIAMARSLASAARCNAVTSFNTSIVDVSYTQNKKPIYVVLLVAGDIGNVE
ncbi:putative C2 calcium dependent membrane targeting [Blattamonas nauphoetae]|uniref:C2 calcium dependent membrane targeting n=1 Tax=Blattamonas nauphoetae TaxID=2049346 RepID=A0ABQ9XSH0_9EUKA|nr:putative C2 calcium dependent membrane targeting [Blattamonas nauphoetae]